MGRGQDPIPTERLPLLDKDLWFAAEKTATQRGKLELQRQWACVGESFYVPSRLRQSAEPLRRAEEGPWFSWLSCAPLTSWSDVSLPTSFIEGMHAVGQSRMQLTRLTLEEAPAGQICTMRRSEHP